MTRPRWKIARGLAVVCRGEGEGERLRKVVVGALGLGLGLEGG